MDALILKRIKEKVFLLDGGLGTELIKHGFSMGSCPEMWNLERPEVIRSIHRDYFRAGSDAVLTNSFGGSAIKLSSFALEKQCYELNKTAAILASEVKPDGKFIGGSVGPTGKFLKPQGEFSEKEFERAFEEQIKGLVDGGIDFLLIETQYDLREAICAVRASNRCTELPVFVTMTFNKTPRGFFTIMGNSFSQFAEEMKKKQVSAIGANCTLDSRDMLELVTVMRERTPLPLIAQANSGKPEVLSTGEVKYSQPLDDYIRYVPQMIRNGVNIIGGCCGTDPGYIRSIATVLKSL